MKIANNIIDLRSSNDIKSIILGKNKFINIASSEYRPPYEVLSSITFSGDEYFDTGILGDVNTKIEAGIFLTSMPSIESEGNYYICGSRSGSATANNIDCIWSWQSGLVCDFNNSAYATYRLSVSKTNLALNTVYDVVINKSKREISRNGTPLGSNTNANSDTFTSTNTICIGLVNGANISSYTGFNGGLKYFKINNDDYIPVLDNQMRPCLYNRTNQTFLYAKKISDGTTTYDLGYTRWNKYAVSYIQNDTNSYIKTGVIDENDDLSFEADFTYFSGSGYQYVLGAYGGDSYKNTVLYINSSNSIGAWVNKAYTQTAMLPNIVAANARIKCYADTTKSIINNGTPTTDFSEGTARTGAELYIFRRNGDGGSTQPQSTSNAIIGLHSLKINIGDVIVRDYEPSVRTNNNTTIVFLYDKVYNKAYDNAGSGSFIAGA